MKNHRLVEARKEKNLKQTQLARMLGFKDKQSVSNWENGHSTPTLETAIRLSRILEKDIVFLFGYNVQDRSEEHTSELQSRGHLVCRLLLEKKKKNITKVIDNKHKKIN